MNENPEIQPLIEQLSNKTSAKRCSAAKKLRKLKAKNAGPDLFKALQKELKDKRTWETQYQMIMALGETEYLDSLDFLTELSKETFEATMVYSAIGDAITRLSHFKGDAISYVLKVLEDKDSPWLLITGALRAVAMLQLVPDQQAIDTIIDYGNTRDLDDSLRLWVVLAAAGWSGKRVDDFLRHSSLSKIQETQKSVAAALDKKYIKLNPL